MLPTQPAPTVKNACAFVATSFGFGPVSKAVTIAQEMKAQAPHVALHYYGDGISYDYVQKSEVFDAIINVNVDRREPLADLLPQLASYRAVVSVLNLDILPLWRAELPPLYFVDSLAWMWSALPDGVENTAAYFVQDYLLPQERIDVWTSACNLVLVAPIESASSALLQLPAVKVDRLLVSFSGCSNPYAPAGLYEKYVRVLASAILEAVDQRYEQVVFCCNERLADYLRASLGSAPRVSMGHFAHDEFVRLLSTSRKVLSTPGITATLEALASQTRLGFLLPQNDSQALMSEHYRRLLGDDCCMAFTRFGAEFSFPPYLPASESVTLALRLLNEILNTRERDLRAMIRDLVHLPRNCSISKLRQNINREWTNPGQHTIAAHVLTKLG